MKIRGSVAPGYESVKSLFESNFLSGKEDNAQCCVYVDGVNVVDLWGSTNDELYNGNSLQNVFSSTKNVSAIAMAALVDRGIIEYSDLVSKHWPEYGTNGKETQTIADILRHESGLQHLTTSINVDDFQRENIKDSNSMGRILAEQTPYFPKISKRVYHSFTRGWILNEIFRRAHPEGFTIGEFVEKDISDFDVDGCIGRHDEKMARVSDIVAWSFKYVIAQSTIPAFAGSKVDCTLLDLYRFKKWIQSCKENSSNPVEPRPSALDIMDDKDSPNKTVSIFNLPKLRDGEIPSANGHFSARGLAKLATIMANKGEHDGKRLISEETWNKMHGEIEAKFDTARGVSESFSQGGINYYEHHPDHDGNAVTTELRNGYYGWQGFGGSVFQWHPEYKIGFAYAPTLITWYDFANMKGARLQYEVLKCAKSSLPK